MTDYQIHTFPNGLRLVHQHVNHDSAVGHLGLIINTGSRDELKKENGLAHFIEHVIFKGTKKRKAFHVLSRLEDVGAELNAYTSKEETVLQAAFLNQHYERSLELIADIVINSTFPQKELDKEKEVVIDEINSYKDSPADQIFDDFDLLLFPKHPLGLDILGTKARIRKFTQKDVFQFIKKHYLASEMVLSSVGNIPFEELISLTEKYFSDLSSDKKRKKRIAPPEYQAVEISKKKRVYQAHCMIGNRAYSIQEDKRAAFSLLNNYLGGPGLNSRLNLGIREKYGFTYNLESNYAALSDTGQFSVYLGTDHQYLEKTIQLVHKELRLLRDVKLGPVQLRKAKQQIVGQIAISEESNANKMLNNGRSLLSFNKISGLDTINKKLNSVTAEMIQEVANEIFDPKKLSMLIYQ
ncbi:MAG: insulinase family protein [Bacteroidales bacterium]|nr:insulinase family protein [Bacteroidales bacterium]